MVRAFKHGQMGLGMKENGKITKLTEKENFCT